MRRHAAILGVSADYHDAACALIVDGSIVAAAEEERFSRVKHDPDLPIAAIEWMLSDGFVAPNSEIALVFYEKPFSKFERILAEQRMIGPRGARSFVRAAPGWARSKIWIGARLERTVERLGHSPLRTRYASHHQSHAAAAFFPSPFSEATVVTLDGVGEWTSASIAHGTGNSIRPLATQSYPHSLGMFYSAFTVFCGFDANDGEYKLMGLAPYGSDRFVDVLRDEVIAVSEDGSIRLNDRYFAFRAGRRMTTPLLDALLGGPPSPLGTPPGQREADIAAAVQQITEEAVTKTVRYAIERTGSRSVCMAGGVALNCVANQRLVERGIVDELWVQPAAGDAGGALGAALWEWHQSRGNPREVDLRSGMDRMGGALLGPKFDPESVASFLDATGVTYRSDVTSAACEYAATALSAGRIVGWFSGRMEFGPRALGGRSILADPRTSDVVGRLNSMVKGREGFRPFAPAVLKERADEWFEISGSAPYMTRTARVRSHVGCGPATAGTAHPLSFAERLASSSSLIPACTHVDGSARVQTIDRETNPEFHRLVSAFDSITHCPVVLNTSFNRAGEPIVRSPYDALRCAAQAGLDALVIEGLVIEGTELARHRGRLS